MTARRACSSGISRLSDVADRSCAAPRTTCCVSAIRPPPGRGFKLVESIMGPEDVPGNVYKMQMGLFSPAHSGSIFGADRQ